MLNYFTLNTTVELFCFFTALICLRKDISLAWRSMMLFLLITCITEMLGHHIRMLYLADRVHVRPNVWLYNGLLLFQAAFISFMFQHLLNKYINSMPIILGGLALLAILYVYEILDHGIYVYNEKTNTVMLVLFVLYSLFFYYQLLKDDRYVSLIYSAEFWWVAGLLFFYFGSTACNIFFDNIPKETAKSLMGLSGLIFKILNVIYYGCWSYSFICRRWLTTTSKA